MNQVTHDSAVVEMLRVERAFGGECLLAALEEAHEPGGVGALLMALRHIYQAEGLKDV